MITVHWRSGCGYCPELKVKLHLARVRFQAADIRADGDTAAAVREANHGDELVPTVRVRDQFLSNPTIGQVETALAAG